MHRIVYRHPWWWSCKSRQAKQIRVKCTKCNTLLYFAFVVFCNFFSLLRMYIKNKTLKEYFVGLNYLSHKHMCVYVNFTNVIHEHKVQLTRVQLKFTRVMHHACVCVCKYHLFIFEFISISRGDSSFKFYISIEKTNIIKYVSEYITAKHNTCTQKIVDQRQVMWVQFFFV